VVSENENPAAPRNRRLAVALAIILVIAVGGWFAFAGFSSAPSNSNKTQKSDTSFGPTIVSDTQLKNQLAGVGHLNYWLGDIPKTKIELTILADRTVFVRYLPIGVTAGDKAVYLTVATYPRKTAYSQVGAMTKLPSAKWAKDKGGALVAGKSPTEVNFYFAFSYSPLLIDVFDPVPGAGWDRIQRGQVKLIS
jgi:hypothetical protein